MIAEELSLRRGPLRRVRGLLPFVGDLDEAVGGIEPGSSSTGSVHADRIIEHQFDVKTGLPPRAYLPTERRAVSPPTELVPTVIS